MGVSVEQWRAAIGSYNAGKSCSLAQSSSSSRVSVLISNLFSLLCFVATTSLQSAMKALMLMILLSGDVERNPGPDIMDCRPTMPQLTDFPAKTGHINIATMIGVKFSVVGTALLNDESGSVIPAIVLEHGKNAEQINMDILSRWIQGQGIADHTWRGLLGVLRVHCPGLAQDIEETLRAEDIKEPLAESATTPETAPTPAKRRRLDDDSGTLTFDRKDSVGVKYRHYLQAIYTRSELPNLKWPPSPGKKFINLEVIRTNTLENDQHTEVILGGDVAQIQKKKEPIQLENILKAGVDEQLKCVLVEGSPGIGKSTLAWHICRRWGKGELFQEFSIVQLLQLRDARVQAATCLEDIFHHYDKKLQSETAQAISDSHGKGILIILDGLDELPSQLLSQPSIFTGLLSGEVLPQANIMITTRPSATYKVWANWNQQISRRIQIIGFTRNNITEYVKSVLPSDELPQFEKYLSNHPHIKRMMYVPLHSAIVTNIYSECHKSRRHPPRTLTGLYTCLAQTLLIRYLNNDHAYKGEDFCLDRLDNLPVPVYADFKKLCAVAFEGICNKKLVFYDLPQKFNHLGFMAAVPELTLYRQPPHYSHNFLHLSVQEFLAAHHVSLLTPLEQEKLLRHTDYGYTWIRFLAGITQFKGLNKVVVRKAIGIMDTEHIFVNEEHLRIIYESQDVNSILDDKCYCEVKMVNFGDGSYYAFEALGYCIANSSSKWSLCIEWEKWQAIELDFSGFKAFTQQLKEHKSYTIDVLSLRKCPPKAIALLLPAVTSLNTLDMSELEFTKQSMQAVVSVLQLNLPENRMDIDECTINNDCAGCLSMELLRNTTMKELNIVDNSVDDHEGVLALDEIKYNATLTELNMSGNSERGVPNKTEYSEDIDYKMNLIKGVLRLFVTTQRDAEFIGPKEAQDMIDEVEHGTTLFCTTMRSSCLATSLMQAEEGPEITIFSCSADLPRY